MRRRFLSAGLATLLGASLAIAPASSQDADVFTIAPTEGVPDDEVTTQLATTEIDERCYTDAADVLAGDPPTPMAELIEQLTARTLEQEADSNESVASQVLGLVFTVMSADEALTEQLLANTYILTFVDIGTMSPVGDTSTFDPATGAGEIVVPDLDPGLWAVAASCVFPDASDPSTYAVALAAAVEFLAAEFETDELDFATIVGGLLGDTTIAERMLREVLPALMAPQMSEAGPAQWTAPFTILRDLPPADPAVAAFCATIPQLPALGEALLTTLAALPEDDGEMTQEEWEAEADWAALATELESLVGDIEALLAAGDTSRPDELADDWASATAPLRQLRDALQAVDYDLSSETGRMIAGQLRDQAVASGEAEGEDPAVAALTAWFLANCLPEGETPPPAPAPAAQPRGAQPSYTG